MWSKHVMWTSRIQASPEDTCALEDIHDTANDSRVIKLRARTCHLENISHYLVKHPVLTVCVHFSSQQHLSIYQTHTSCCGWNLYYTGLFHNAGPMLVFITIYIYTLYTQKLLTASSRQVTHTSSSSSSERIIIHSFFSSAADRVMAPVIRG